MSEQHYLEAVRLFEADWQHIRHVSIDQTLLEDASRLSVTHGLRVYDAMAIVPLGVRFMTFDAQLRLSAGQILPELCMP